MCSSPANRGGRRSSSPASGSTPCRLWLRDFDGDGRAEGYLGGGGSDPACYDLKKVSCKWTFAGAPFTRATRLGISTATASPSMVSGGGDGFLYVVAPGRQVPFSRSMGAAITVLAVVPGLADREGRDALAVGLETGQVLLPRPRLEADGSAELGEPVEHLAALAARRLSPSAILAAGNSGQAIRIDLEPLGRAELTGEGSPISSRILRYAQNDGLLRFDEHDTVNEDCVQLGIVSVGEPEVCAGDEVDNAQIDPAELLVERAVFGREILRGRGAWS